MAALSSFALSVLSVEQAMERRSCVSGHGASQTASDQSVGSAPVEVTTQTTRPARSSRRATSHYNSFQTVCSTDQNDPPSYTTAIRQRQSSCRVEEGQERLPAYSCTVSAQMKVLLNLELINPLHSVSESEWREAWVILRGTMLSVHRVKDGVVGKLLRAYTLQHAEVGLAIDSSYTTLTPNTKLAHLIPGAARQKAFKKDPRLFKSHKQYILRLRVETDQLLFALPSEEAIHDFVNTISAGIDIAQPIDDRSATRQCTVPRRRRRNRTQFNGDVSDPAVIAEQERIFRAMYPALAETPQATHPAPPSPLRDDDEVDVSALREEVPAQASATPSSQRPQITRATSQDSIESRSGDDMLSACDTNNISPDGKWQPPHTRSATQTLRYARRCMPVLLADAPRASDVLICSGRRVKINWRTEALDAWELKPPSYRSHAFEPQKPALERSSSRTSASSSVDHAQTPDQITPLVEVNLSSLDLTKVVSSPAGIDKAIPSPNSKSFSRARRAEVDAMTAVQGIVYCF